MEAFLQTNRTLLFVNISLENKTLFQMPEFSVHYYYFIFQLQMVRKVLRLEYHRLIQMSMGMLTYFFPLNKISTKLIQSGLSGEDPDLSLISLYRLSELNFP